MDEVTLGGARDRLTVQLTQGEPAYLATRSASGSWPEPPLLRIYWPSGTVAWSGTAEVDGEGVATWEISLAQVDQLYERPRAFMARMFVGGDQVAVGPVEWAGSWFRTVANLALSSVQTVGSVRDYDAEAAADRAEAAAALAQGLVEDVDGALSTIAGVQGALDAHAADISDLQDGQSAVESSVTALQGAVTAAQGNITSLQGSVTAAQGTISSHTALLSVLEARSLATRYVPNQLATGPASTDGPTVTTGVAGDAAFNQQYQIGGNALPAVWPVDFFGPGTIINNLQAAKTSNAAIATVSTYRTVLDGLELALFTYADNNFTIDLFIDGRPYANNPITPLPTSGFTPYGFQKFVWGTAKPEGRLLEFRMIGGVNSVFTKKPYSLRKPPADRNPKVCVVGDSYVAPTVMQDAANAQVTSDLFLSGIYQRMQADLGITSMVTDGVSGTGVLAPGGSARPYTHAERLAWLQACNPDVIIVHGGGANDLYQGNSVSSIVAAFTSYFQTLRTNHPSAKLVFVEGFSPPLFTPATYNPNYVSIRQGVQTNLAAAGVGAYFIAVASLNPTPINGTGYLGATNASGNSDIYVGFDAVHLSRAGNRAARGVLARRLSRVLHDQGPLVGQLVA